MTSDGDAATRRKRVPRPPTLPPDVPTWPSGYEIARHHVPPLAEDIHKHVNQLKRGFDEGRGYDPVLRAIEYIAVARMQGVMWAAAGQVEKLPPVSNEDGVMLPWWVLDALAGAIQKMRREHGSLDQILGLRGSGRGKSGWAQQIDEIGEHLNRATEVSYLIEHCGLAKARAIDLVADRYRISDEAIRSSIAAAEARGFKMPPLRRGRRPKPK